MSGPHVHAELIKAWADGDEIQVYIDYEWQDNAQPSWSDKLQYRIKKAKDFSRIYQTMGEAVLCRYADQHHNLKLTFDGETGRLKAAEVLK